MYLSTCLGLPFGSNEFGAIAVSPLNQLWVAGDAGINVCDLNGELQYRVNCSDPVKGLAFGFDGKEWLAYLSHNNQNAITARSLDDGRVVRSFGSSGKGKGQHAFGYPPDHESASKLKVKPDRERGGLVRLDRSDSDLLVPITTS